jgi:hypothetical protein
LGSRHFLAGSETSTAPAAQGRREEPAQSAKQPEAALSATDRRRFSAAAEVVCEEEALAEG